ncbi:phage holin family protein [Candidatus Collierbacteria bacterium]|nr:phage holin family protein [Candidatus Collierbacteria bacterium]
MKTVLRAIFLNLVTLYAITLFFPGLTIEKKLVTFLSAAVVWTLLNKVIKPIIKLLLLPINLITLGLFSWVINVFTLYLLSHLIAGVKINPFVFNGFTYQGFTIPQISFNLFLAYILTSITLNLVHSGLIWLLRH